MRSDCPGSASRNPSPLREAILHRCPPPAETFEVLDGRIRAILGGRQRWYGAGEAIHVAAGTPHQMAAEEPSRMRWQVRPALRTAEFCEQFHGDGPDGARSARARGPPRGFADEIRLTGS